MKAILLSDKNATIISESTTLTKFPLTTAQVKTKVDIPNLIYPGEKTYFIPDYVAPDGSNFGGWATIPEQYFLENFNTDMTNIETEYVQTTHKQK